MAVHSVIAPTVQKIQYKLSFTIDREDLFERFKTKNE